MTEKSPDERPHGLVVGLDKLGVEALFDDLIIARAAPSSAKLTEVLGAAPRYGSVRVARLLEHCRVSPTKTIGGLSPRQRRELVAALEE